MTGDTKIKTRFDLYKSYFPNIKIDTEEVEVYSDIDKEYEALRYGVAIRDISSSSMLILTGNDVLDYLHRISTNSTKDLEMLKYVKTLFTSEKGRVIDDTVLLHLENFKLLIGSPEVKEKLWYWLDKYIIMEDIKTRDSGDDYNLFEILGPQKDSYMTLLCGNDCEEVKENFIFPRDIEGIDLYLLKLKESAGIEKYWILVRSNDTETFLRYLAEHESAFDVKMVGKEAYNIFRNEIGIPKAPNEINDSYNPYEVNLIDNVNFTKGCYIGQEVIARLNTYDKVQKELTGVLLEDDFEETDLPLDLVSRENKDAGKLTSKSYSKILKKNMGLAVIRKEYLNPGTELFAAAPDGNKLRLKVVKIPVRR